jgi:hypothetical protein
MANVLIDIASEFTGKKAFNQADKATEKLSKNVKKLAGAFGLAFSTTAVLAYGKASVKAAAADQKAQQQLALALKNVGLERDAATSEALIQRLQSEYGIVDDLLRPAYQSLAIATRDTVEAQRLLNLSLDISAATGKDLGSVTTALSRAYLGNNTALSRLGVGISKADLKAKSFYEITTDLQDTFKGSATAAANTFQGSMDKLGVASANVSEIIGTSLIDALKGLGDENSVDDLAASMERVAQRTGDIIRGIGVLINKLKQLPGMPDFSVLYDISYLRLLEKIGSNSRAGSAGGFPQGPPADLTRQFANPQSKPDKVAKDTLKINKESLKLAKARATFDLQKIQIEAALKGKISEEDKIRLKLMKAILEENVSDVEKYQKALEKAQEKSKELSDLLTSIKDLEMKDPFGQWKVDPLTASINALTASMFAVQTQIQANGKEWSSFANSVATTVIRPNLTEWSSSYSTASANAAAATAAANAALTATTTAAAKAAAEAAAASAAAIAASNKTASEETASAAAASAAAIAAANKASADAIAKAQAEAASTLGKLNAETAASTAAAAKAAQDAIDAANKTAAETVAAILAKASAEAAAKAATAAAANVSTLEAFRAAEAAAAQTTATGGTTKIEVTVTGDPFTDPNAVAEKVVEIIRSAANRGTVDVLGFE